MKLKEARLAEKSCYMCEKSATTREHVPPRCLFPEISENASLGFPGKDFRKNLFIVPSCEEHNSGKSKDDEFLWYSLSFCNAINHLAVKYFLSKGKRAHKHHPGIFQRMFQRSRMTILTDEDGEYRAPKFYFEPERFALLMERVGKGLYFRHYGKKYRGAVQTHAEYAGVDVVCAGIGAELIARMKIEELFQSRERIKEEFSGADEYGENREVFYYSAKEINGNLMMRLTFYEGARVLLIFSGDRSSLLSV